MAKTVAKELQTPGVSTKADVLAGLKRVISKQKLNQVFTSSFDKGIYNLPAKENKKVIQAQWRLSKLARSLLGFASSVAICRGMVSQRPEMHVLILHRS